MSNILDEIPYIVTPRKDTGLFNSKIAIWLFLASEVMLFGGLFSGYIFLRIYADYPWPERALPVMPGFINTFVLIGSSVTVVFAWASLKMRKYFQFQVYMGITLLCALGFMVLKTMEYKAKFAHQAVRMEESFAIVEGHFHHPKSDDHADAGSEPKVIMAAAGGDDHGSATDSHAGGHHDPNIINFETESVNITLKRFYEPYINDILAQAEAQGATFTLLGSDKSLTIDYLEDQRSILLDIQTKNSKLRTAALRKAWEVARAEHSELNSRELAPLVKVDTEALDPHLTKEITAFTFLASKPVTLKFDPGKILEGKEKATLHDDTILSGKLLSSPYTLNVDTIDFRFTAMKAEERHQDPIDVIDNSWIVTHNPQIKQIWEKHKQKTAELRQHLIETRGTNEETGEPNQVPNENDLYRITWQEMVTTLGFEEEQPGILEGFTGPDHKKYAFPEVSIPREKVAFESNLTPRWNTYYAIYFLMTGLHGLHVIGGALVLGYFGFCSKKMYQENPEWLANRVEVGGLFWHFVDLVWIFLFPIMYLM